ACFGKLAETATELHGERCPVRVEHRAVDHALLATRANRHVADTPAHDEHPQPLAAELEVDILPGRDGHEAAPQPELDGSTSDDRPGSAWIRWGARSRRAGRDPAHKEQVPAVHGGPALASHDRAPVPRPPALSPDAPPGQTDRP